MSTSAEMRTPSEMNSNQWTHCRSFIGNNGLAGLIYMFEKRFPVFIPEPTKPKEENQGQGGRGGREREGENEREKDSTLNT
jgi:hypothetical protein